MERADPYAATLLLPARTNKRSVGSNASQVECLADETLAREANRLALLVSSVEAADAMNGPIQSKAVGFVPARRQKLLGLRGLALLDEASTLLVIIRGGRSLNDLYCGSSLSASSLTPIRLRPRRVAYAEPSRRRRRGVFLSFQRMRKSDDELAQRSDCP
jgi:hypothetical protein